MFANPIDAETTVIRIKACRIRNDLRESLRYRTLYLWVADQDLMITRFSIATTRS
jgi:hypothetical protein